MAGNTPADALRERGANMTERQEKIIGLLVQGLTYAEVQKLTGYDQHNVRKIAVKYGVDYTDEKKKTEQLERVREIVAQFGAEYVGGYENNKSRITVRLACGHKTEILWLQLIDGRRQRKAIDCEACRKIRRAEEAKQKLEKSASKGRQLAFSICPVCGSAVYTGRKYCSNECANKAHNKTKDVKRRKRISQKEQDAGITVDALYKRDNGTCYLCGGACDFSDFKKDGDVFIVGETYPSIDHVVPLSKGGTHTWENVRLAHHRCNTIKGNRTEEYATDSIRRRNGETCKPHTRKPLVDCASGA